VKREGSLFEVEVDGTDLWGKIKVLATNSCFVYLILAGFFRFWAGYCLGFLSGSFFEHRYKAYIDAYKYAGTFIVVGGGLPASVAGGYLSDKFESQIGSMKGLIAGVGALAAIPFIYVAYIVQPSFWGSIVCYYIAYFIGEMWYGPSHAQINNISLRNSKALLLPYSTCLARQLAHWALLS